MSHISMNNDSHIHTSVIGMYSLQKEASGAEGRSGGRLRPVNSVYAVAFTYKNFRKRLKISGAERGSEKRYFGPRSKV